MRKNLPVTQREITVPEGMRLISTTSLKGVITYCNDDFEAISGFSRAELIGQAHNLIRHPDMPPAVFADMWEYLKAGKAWMGVVKNRAKSGDHYWVSAYATPIWENGQMVGYESVRVAATRDQIARAEGLYARISAGKMLSSFTNRAVSMARAGWPFILSLIITFGALQLESGLLAALIVVVGHALAFSLVSGSISSRLKALLALRSDAFQDPIVARTYSHERGLMSRLALVLVSEEARVRTALARIDDQAEHLYEQARASHNYISEGATAIARQRSETDQIASAINEMTASIQEVAEAVTHNAREAEQANNLAHDGRERSGEALVAIEQLVDRVNGIGESVGRLGESTRTIGEAADLISDIADQTNLLALNAAIEAARAGEQGRGFAVVADEVRSLAQRTRQSTVKIQDVIKDFRTQVEETVQAVKAGEEIAGEGLARVQGAADALGTIVGSVDSISDSFITMSAAFEEQSQVSDEINRQIVNIAELADQSDEQADAAKTSSDTLSGMAHGLKDLISRFASKSG
ncbi:PAS domain-containing methyl-accepting chemotaxis protein [Marinobacter sp.]|uniref:methyl-accepting chemotaxis protein n=1 Tax=Marinobacter sp. TaxID=50741 RepID=UPI0019ECF5B3|nr:PAS domain-containing methyl-accepting chemotaxis protein [Marinobacter sp.]MBE0486496.1 methyl-accepting chemotaxis protein [Marinobacter sp.]